MTLRALSIVGHDQDGGRPKDDFYPTEPEATEALLRVETFSPQVWEPACGEGHISKVLEAAGHRVHSSDLNDHGYGQEHRLDFLMAGQKPNADIVTNPPLGLAEEFARHALALKTRKTALLLKLVFLEGVRRTRWLEKSPLKKVWVFRRRLSFARGGKPQRNRGMIAFAWFVWERGHEGPPEIGWL